MVHQQTLQAGGREILNAVQQIPVGVLPVAYLLVEGSLNFIQKFDTIYPGVRNNLTFMNDSDGGNLRTRVLNDFSEISNRQNWLSANYEAEVS